jgi:hypothetical protein
MLAKPPQPCAPAGKVNVLPSSLITVSPKASEKLAVLADANELIEAISIMATNFTELEETLARQAVRFVM